ncbi:3-methyl-2-oxobutanoate hydroxymethyltransferase [Candidatus Margulisiibacteriota bacterium]
MTSLKVMTTRKLKEMKKAGNRIAVLTAYDYPTAKILDAAGVDVILVGDSLGNAVLGYENTLPVTMEEMIHHTKAVVRGVKSSMVVADMPFMSYQLSEEEMLKNASRFIKEAGADAVKVEGDAYLDRIKKIIDAGIPVMGHIGFTPQSVKQIGGYRVQGRSENEKKELLGSAKKLEKAGVFSLVLEMVPEDTAKNITESISIPTIGCGAGRYCDGQVLVYHDLVGLTNGDMPKFAKKYIDLNKDITKAVSSYMKDVKAGSFPAKKQTY